MLDFFRIPSAAVPPAPLERFRFPPSDLCKFFSRASRIHNFPVRTAVFLAARLCRSLTRRGGRGGFDVQFMQKYWDFTNNSRFVQWIFSVPACKMELEADAK